MNKRGLKVDSKDFEKRFESYKKENTYTQGQALEKINISQFIYLKIRNGKKLDTRTIERIRLSYDGLKLL